ncbi:MIP family channel protein [Streptomyces californicus]
MVLAVTHKVAVVGFDGLPIGLALAAIHLVGIPLTGTSVNPARSLGPALFAGGAALTQLWLFIIAPLVGGAIAAYAHRLTHPYPNVLPAEPEAAIRTAAPATTGARRPTGGRRAP